MRSTLSIQRNKEKVDAIFLHVFQPLNRRTPRLSGNPGAGVVVGSEEHDPLPHGPSRTAFAMPSDSSRERMADHPEKIYKSRQGRDK